MKKFILGLGFLVTTVIFLLEYNLIQICELSNYDCRDVVNIFGRTLLFFPLILFFSLITYFMPPRVFTTWWNFAKYSIPIILVLSFIINAGLHHNSTGQWQDIFDLPMLFILYGVFVIGSLVQIIRGFRKK